MTWLLTRSDLLGVLDAEAALGALEDGFRRDDETVITGTRARTELPGPGTATALLPGIVSSIPAYTVKVNAKFPSSTPALRGVVCLHDLGTGELLALLDSGTITAWRTGLSAALATDRLARPDADAVAIIGAGAQADLVVRGLTLLRRLRCLTVSDVDVDAAVRFAERHAGSAAEVEVSSDMKQATAAADIVVTATWATEPLLALADVQAGQHITSLGADEPHKRELASDLITEAVLVVDDRDLVTHTGAIASAGSADMNPPVIDATLGEVLRGAHPGRTTGDQITVYSPVGLPWQDLALAWNAFTTADAKGVGHSIDLLT